ncbi:MAG: DNA repair protein RadC [Planctomycetota bacterium]
MKQLPATERPRERLVSLGPDRLTDAELLAIVIGGGTETSTAVDLGRKLLVRFGGLRQLAGCSPAELQKLRGIGQARSAGVKAALEIGRRLRRQPPATKPGAFLNAEAVFARYGSRLGPEKRETFVALLLDIKNRLIRDVTISQGSLNQSIVHPREVFQPAIRDSAASVIFVHNHPSGDTSPSREDREITRRLKQTGDVIGIGVLDHVIVSETGYTSFADEGLLGKGK